MRKCCEFFNHSLSVGVEPKDIMDYFRHSIENCSKLLILKQADGPHKDYFLTKSLYSTCTLIPGGGGGGVLPNRYMDGLQRYVWPQRVFFSAILVINRVSSLDIFIPNSGSIFVLSP